MNDNPRYLRFANLMQQSEPIRASCNRCNKEFVGVYVFPNERTDEVLLRLRAAFEVHQCDSPVNESACA